MIELRSDGSVYVLINGQTFSKANSRKLVTVYGKPRVIKSLAARTWLAAAEWQVKPIEPLLEGELRADIDIYYPSKRQDLDPSLVLDFLQGRVYQNDRQVTEMHLLRHTECNFV